MARGGDTAVAARRQGPWPELPVLAGPVEDPGPGTEETVETRGSVRYLRLGRSWVVWRPDIAVGIVTDEEGIRLAQEQSSDRPALRSGRVGEFLEMLEGLGLIPDAPPVACAPEPTGAADRCLRIFVNLTNACNFRCRYCHASSGPRLEGELDTDEWLGVMAQIPALRPGGVTFTGGEALARKDTLTVARSLKRLAPEIPLTLVTNGSLIDRGLAAELAGTFDRIKVSLDGTRRPTTRSAASAPIIRPCAVSSASSRYMPESRRTSLSPPPSWRASTRLLTTSAGPGYGPLSSTRVLLTGSAVDAPELQYTTRDLLQVIERGGPAGRLLKEGVCRFILAQLGKTGPIACGVGHYMNIAADGDVHPCHTLRFPAFLAANVRERPLLEIWRNSPVFQAARSLRIQSVEPCRGCDYRRVCRGGCRGLAYQRGSLTGTPPDCAERMALYSHFLPQVLPSFPLTVVTRAEDGC